MRRVELGATAGEDLVHVGLIPCVDQQHVTGRVEHLVHGDDQLDHARVGSPVSPGPGNLVDQIGVDLLSQRAKRHG